MPERSNKKWVDTIPKGREGGGNPRGYNAGSEMVMKVCGGTVAEEKWYGTLCFGRSRIEHTASKQCQ